MVPSLRSLRLAAGLTCCTAALETLPSFRPSFGAVPPPPSPPETPRNRRWPAAAPWSWRNHRAANISRQIAASITLSSSCARLSPAGMRQ
eukprot:Skav205624  [mRNA]  locus=scaffold4676:67614:77781:+ [translate_table: standard]